ncbi:MAG: glycosyltransferase [Eubacteriales bacterium]|nr:glycosyltransferase [Eubacteriales bacterium]
MEIKVSIIIPVYNVENYLGRCMDSVVSQDMGDLEVILTDDGSTDGSGALCDMYAEKYGFVSAYHKPNGGLSDARNFGLQRSTGEYVLFLDSDDFLTPDALSALYSETTKEKPDVVIGHCNELKKTAAMERFENVVRENLEYHRVYSGKEYLERCLMNGALRVEAWRSLYRREFLLSNNLEFKKGITHEDEEFTPRVLLKAEKVILSDKAFYNYDNTRTGSIMNSSSISDKKAKDIYFILEELEKIYKEVPERKLRRLLLDDITWKYLDCYKRYRGVYVPDGLKRIELVGMAHKPKRIIKALAFAISPALYIRVFGKK